jgi:hypothetical protein
MAASLVTSVSMGRDHDIKCSCTPSAGSAQAGYGPLLAPHQPRRDLGVEQEFGHARTVRIAMRAPKQASDAGHYGNHGSFAQSVQLRPRHRGYLSVRFSTIWTLVGLDLWRSQSVSSWRCRWGSHPDLQRDIEVAHRVLSHVCR